MRMKTVQAERFWRLATLTVTLDATGRPPRASVVAPLLKNSGKQPLETGMHALGGEPDMAEPTSETLSAIADLYGVDRAYLTDIGSDPGREEDISEQLYERRRTLPSPGYNARLDTTQPLPAVHEPIREQVDVVTQFARRKMWSISAFPGVASLLLLALTPLFGYSAVTGDVSGGGGVGVRVVMGALSVVMGITALRLLFLAAKAIRLAIADRMVFDVAIHTALRRHIASKLHYYLTTTDLPYDFFTATIGHELPIENGTLDRLAGGDKSKKANIIHEAVMEHLF
jgi:hypothetical protein